MHANLKGRMEQRTAKAEHWLKIMETLCTNDLAKGGVLLRLSRHLRRHRGLRLLLLPLGLQFSLKNKLHNYLHFKRSKVRQQSLASGHLAPAPCFHGAARHWTKPRHFLSRKLVLNKYLFSSLCNEKIIIKIIYLKFRMVAETKCLLYVHIWLRVIQESSLCYNHFLSN